MDYIIILAYQEMESAPANTALEATKWKKAALWDGLFSFIIVTVLILLANKKDVENKSAWMGESLEWFIVSSGLKSE